MKKLLVLSLALAACAAHAETISIECEAFEDWGGWVNDTQFMDQMGSPYLLAHGLGKPVADAKTSFEVKEGGAYTVWARTRNWTANWGELAAGLFNLVIDGRALGAPLGTGESGWRFVNVGQIALAPGKHTLALHDLTGFDGRCDVIVLSNVPVAESRLNVRQHPFVTGSDKTYDLCVVGGGIGGICTAVSAARLGLKVALVHDRPILGGNNSSEVRVHLGAWQNMPPYPRLGDVLAEFGPPTGGNAEPATNYFDEAKLRIVKAEKNIDLFLNEHVADAQTDAKGRITAVSSLNTRTGERRRFAAKWFADCTGDGTVGFLAKADYRMGREARSETGEPWAPATADMLTMGSSVQWRAKKADRPVPFFIRPWMIGFTDENGYSRLKGDWDWEAGLGRDQLKEAEYIRDYGLLVAYSNWAYVKNVASNRAEFVDKELEWVAYNAGRRETRRLMGDFILTEKHIQDRDFQPDGTCAATWTIDLHFPKTAAETKFGGEPFRSNSENEKIWPYPIPYRCYYSRNVPNLFMAGRCISVTHVALGTVRLMRTIGMMGEVVGMAASVCKAHGCDPRDVYTSHFGELKALMEKGVGDGKAHPPQMYNIQNSLDPRFRDRKAGNYQIR
jgi:hypothetical protein